MWISHKTVTETLNHNNGLMKLVLALLFFACVVPGMAQYNMKKLMAEGRRTLNEGYYVVAMQIFQRAAGLRPDLYEAWYLGGVAKYHLEDYKGAEDDCTRAIDINPFIVEIYELRAMSRLREEKYDSAIVDFTHAIEMNPDNRDYWFNRAYCYSQEHVFNIALQQLDYIQKRWSNFRQAEDLRQTILATMRLRRDGDGNKK